MCNSEHGHNVYSRRQMLELMLRYGAGAAATTVGLGALQFFSPSAGAATIDTDKLKKAYCQKSLPDKKVKCLLCPREVTLSEGKNCFCRTRRNIDGTLYARGYDKPCIVNFDPVERGPLYHFMPGTTSLALGAAGCNMNCLYCQNYQLAQSSPEDVRRKDVDEKAMMSSGKAQSIMLTYTDASCQPEYLVFLAKLAQKANLKVILCTGAYINQKPLKKLIPYVDAFAVTLKAATDDAYLKLTEVQLAPVQESIKTIHKSGKWLEVVTLVVPGYNDDREGIESIAGWLHQNLGSDVPWHLSRFTPNYKLKKLPPTPRKTLEEARLVGLKNGLNYVYITNLAPHQGNHSYCPKCKTKLIERLGFKLRKNNLMADKCPKCASVIPGVWQ